MAVKFARQLHLHITPAYTITALWFVLDNALTMIASSTWPGNTWKLSIISISEPPHDKTNEMDVCSAKTQISLGIRCPHDTLDPQIPTKHTAKTLIRLGACPGWSESSLGVHAISMVLSWGRSNLPDAKRTSGYWRMVSRVSWLQLIWQRTGGARKLHLPTTPANPEKNEPRHEETCLWGLHPG